MGVAAIGLVLFNPAYLALGFGPGRSRSPTSGSVSLGELQNISYRYLAWDCFRAALSQFYNSRGVHVMSQSLAIDRSHGGCVCVHMSQKVVKGRGQYLRGYQ